MAIFANPELETHSSSVYFAKPDKNIVFLLGGSRIWAKAAERARQS